MGSKSAKIEGLVAACRGRDQDAHYLAYFECFNRGWYFEAHEVLEVIWVADREGGNGAFYKGLIQLAGAFVHLQKNRLRPAAALFKLARENLEKYPDLHEQLDVAFVVRGLIATWLKQVEEGGFTLNPLTVGNEPELKLGG